MARETPTLHGKCHFKSLFFWNPSLIFGHSGAKGKKKAPDSDKEPVGTVHTHSVFLREKNLKLPLNVFFRLLNFSIFIPPTQFLVISDNRH